MNTFLQQCFNGDIRMNFSTICVLVLFVVSVSLVTQLFIDAVEWLIEKGRSFHASRKNKTK